MSRRKSILSYVSYIFRSKIGCYITVYGSSNEKIIAICSGQTEAISLVFNKRTCKLLEEFIEKLQAMLEEF